MRFLISLLTGLAIFVFFLVSIFIFEELILKFLASTLFSLLLFYLLYFLYALWSLKRKPVDISNIVSPVLYPGEKAELELTGENLVLPFIGTYITLRFDMYENHECIAANINRFCTTITKKRLIFEYTPRRHGLYTMKNFRIVIRDLFGFTELQAKVPFEHNFQVFPGYLHEVKIPFLTDKGGDRIIHSVIKEKSTDFFENRKYFPGDDTRKINWKIFAHSDELHIREVEQIPPKMGEVSIAFAPYSSSLTEYEYISSLFFTTIHHLVSYGITVHVLSPSFDKPVKIDQNEEKQFTMLLNSSFQPFSHTQVLRGMSSPIFFASYEEAVNLFSKGLITGKEYLIFSYDNLDIPGSRFLSALFYIEKHDTLFSEFKALLGRRNAFFKRRKELDKLKSIYASSPETFRMYETESGDYDRK